jgi:hypothetical protein
MINNYKNFLLGCIIFITPFLGFSLDVKFFLVSFFGVVLVLYSINFNFKKRWVRFGDLLDKKTHFNNANTEESVSNEVFIDKVIIKKSRKPRKKKEVEILNDNSSSEEDQIQTNSIKDLPNDDLIKIESVDNKNEDVA